MAERDEEEDGEEQQLLAPAESGGRGGSGGSPGAGPRGGSSLATLMRVRRYPPVFVAGCLFDVARNAIGFLGAYYMNECVLQTFSPSTQPPSFAAAGRATHSPRLVQLTGSAQWAFLIAGPCFGLLSDKYDRRRTVLNVLAFMTALTLVLVALLSTSLMVWPLMYLYMVMASMCTVLDTTNRPAMIYDLLFAAESEHLVTTAMGL